MNTNEKFYENDNGVYFKSDYLSQWHEAPMVIDNITYNSCEQYMMHQKALYFNDHESAEQILKTTNPKIQKSLGRLVRNFDENKWNEVCETVVYNGNYAKFTQNLDLKQLLLATNEKIIVECSPYDEIWGNGHNITDTLRIPPEEWKGTNKLGKALMLVRKNIR